MREVLHSILNELAELNWILLRQEANCGSEKL